MNSRPVPLAAAVSGIVSIVLLFAGQAVSGSSPDLTASRAKITAWAATHHGGAAHYAGATMELLGILGMIVFAAALWSVLRRGDSEDGIAAATAFGAGLTSAAVKLASGPAVFAATWRHDLNPQLAAALVDMNNVAFVLTWPLDAIMLGAAATVIFRHAVLPRWLGWFGSVTAVLLVVSAPAADHVPPLGMLLGFAWIVCTSIVLTRQTLRPGRTAAIATA